jgi:hypothetical protein
MVIDASVEQINKLISSEKAGFIYNEKFGDRILSFLCDFDKYIESNKDELENEFDLYPLKNGIMSVSWCYPIITKTRSIEKIDRTKSLIAGPLYTSAKYPWPKYDGILREPVMQIYLETVYACTNIDCGDGLLQLWVGPYFDDGNGQDSLIRIIPSADVLNSELSPIPSEISENYFFDQEFTAGKVGIWPNCLENCRYFEISDIGQRVLTWNQNFGCEVSSQYVGKKPLGMANAIRAIENIVEKFQPYRGHNLFGEGWFFMFNGSDPDLWAEFGHARLVESGDEFVFLWNRYDDFE